MKTLFTVLVLLGALALGQPGAQAAPKPNFILILADDMGYGDIAPFGSTRNRTPNLDRMAREGVKLTSFYAAPVCTPSRAQVLTGCYAKRVSLPHVLMPAAPVGLSSGEHSIAELLKQQGYATMAIGKWHVGDQPEFLPTRHGFDSYFGLPYSNDMGGATNRAQTKRDRPPLPLVENDRVIETVTPEGQNQLTERYTEAAVKFIREHKDTPFFLYMPQTAVHVPIHPGDRFRGKSSHGLYSDWVEELDWSVGQVLETVRSLGLAERTLVVFTSDNGPWLKHGSDAGTAGPLRGGKGGTYEGGVREPTLAWWPGQVPAGAVVDAVAANFDLLPTFVHLAGGTVPSDHPIDGRDLSALLLGRSQDSPHEAYYYFSGNALQAVRSGPWKLAIAPQSENMGEPPATPRGTAFTPTLYNLQADIGERTNVAALHPEVVQRLQALAAKMDADLGLTKQGPGVRPPGRAANPVGLWLPGQAPSANELEAHYDLKPLDQLAIGASLPAEQAPQIAHKPLLISVEVEPQAPSGVIVAQGGSARGYALFLRDGKAVFAVREHDRLVALTATETPAGRFRLEARLARSGAMTLAINGKTAASGQAPGLFTAQPQENFCVGHDDGRTVADYDGKALFRGTLAHLKVVTE